MLQRYCQIAGFLSFCALMAPATLWAADADVERTLAIIELREGPEANSLTADYLTEVVAAFQEANDGNYILVSGQAVAAKIAGSRDQVPTRITDERRASLADAKAKGIEFLDKAEAANAIKALQGAEAKYRAALAAPGADDAMRKEYLDVLAQLATAHLMNKDRDAAMEVFRTVITTFGLKAAVTDDNYRPDVVELFQTIVKEMSALQKGAIDVSSTPPGARIVLGGNDRGATPATIADLIPGVYTLRLQSGNASSMLHRVKISGGGTAKIAIDIGFENNLVVEDKYVGLSYPEFETARQRIEADATTLGRTLGVNMVAAVGVFDQKVVAFLIDVGQGKAERSSNVKVPQVGVSKRAVTKVMGTILGEKAEPANDAAPVAAAPWYTSKPGLISAGVSVISLAVGLAFIGSQFDQKAYYCADATQPCAGSTDTWSDPVNVTKYASNVEDLRGSYQSKQLISGVGIGLGAVLAGVAGYFFYAQSAEAQNADTAIVLPPVGSPHLSVLPPAQLGFQPVSFVGRF